MGRRECQREDGGRGRTGQRKDGGRGRTGQREDGVEEGRGQRKPPTTVNGLSEEIPAKEDAESRVWERVTAARQLETNRQRAEEDAQGNVCCGTRVYPRAHITCGTRGGKGKCFPNKVRLLYHHMEEGK